MSTQVELQLKRPTIGLDVERRLSNLIRLYETGKLGGERMPEDSNPGFLRGSAENYNYFTLPMSLNYQRNSYSLWRSALRTWEDKDTQWVFNPEMVSQASDSATRAALLKHKLALQPTRHVGTWIAISRTICDRYGGDIRGLFSSTGRDAAVLLSVVGAHESGFPCLRGPKISNYWLYVMSSYTEQPLLNRKALSVAPDTHVMQASIAIGLVNEEVLVLSGGRQMVADAWRQLAERGGFAPIDVHTPLWLWSRSGFPSVD